MPALPDALGKRRRYGRRVQRVQRVLSHRAKAGELARRVSCKRAHQNVRAIRLRHEMVPASEKRLETFAEALWQPVQRFLLDEEVVHRLGQVERVSGYRNGVHRYVKLPHERGDGLVWRVNFETAAPPLDYVAECVYTLRLTCSFSCIEKHEAACALAKDLTE
eukprot:147129-Pleurochrysis_carterae.AAC.1